MHSKRLLGVFTVLAMIAGLLSLAAPVRAQDEEPDEVELFMPDGIEADTEDEEDDEDVDGDDGFADGAKTVLSDQEDGEGNFAHLTSVSDEGDRHIYFECDDGTSDFAELEDAFADEESECELLGSDEELEAPDAFAGEFEWNLDEDETVDIYVLACFEEPDFDDDEDEDGIPDNCAADSVDGVTKDDEDDAGSDTSAGEITGVCPSDDEDDCDRNQDFDDNGHGSNLPDPSDGWTFRVSVSEDVGEDGVRMCLDVDATSDQDPDACDVLSDDTRTEDFDTDDPNEMFVEFEGPVDVDEEDEVDVVLLCPNEEEFVGDGAGTCETGDGDPAPAVDTLVMDEHYKVVGEEAPGPAEEDVVLTFEGEDHDDGEVGEDACEDPDREAFNSGEENEILFAHLNGCIFDEDGNLLFDEEATLEITFGNIEDCEGTLHDHDDDGDDEHCHIDPDTDDDEPTAAGGDDTECDEEDPDEDTVGAAVEMCVQGDIYDFLITNDEEADDSGEIGDSTNTFCIDDEQNEADEDDPADQGGHGCPDAAAEESDTAVKHYAGRAEQILIVYADADPSFSDCPTGLKNKQNVVGDTDSLLVCTFDEDGQPASTADEGDSSIRVRSSNASVVLVTNDPSETGSAGTAIVTIEAAGPGSAQIEAELRCSGAPDECPAGTNIEGVVDEDIVSKTVRAAQNPQCSDGIDNDGDGRIDLDDPDCTGPQDNREAHDPVRRRIASTVTIRYDRNARRPAFKGQVSAGRKPCQRQRLVVLFKKRPGRDRRRGDDFTNRAGNYRIVKRRARGRWYVVVRRATRTARNGDTLICLRDKSVTIRVRRRRSRG